MNAIRFFTINLTDDFTTDITGINFINDIIRSSNNNDAEVDDLVLRAVLNERRWPNAQVPFELDSSYSNNKAILIIFFLTLIIYSNFYF